MTETARAMPELRAALDALRDRDALAYPIRMWEVALGATGQPEAGYTRAVGASNALPYVPGVVAALLPADGGPLRVLDLGSLAGYGLYDFRTRHPDLQLDITAVDSHADYNAAGRALARCWAGATPVTFVDTPAERLDLPEASFQLVIARLLLPYAHIRTTLATIGRLTAPGGLLLVQTHAPAYYGRQLWRHRRSVRHLAYYGRPLLSGLIFALFGVHSRGRLWRETALSARGLTRRCRRAGFEPVWRAAVDSPGRPLRAYRRISNSNYERLLR